MNCCNTDHWNQIDSWYEQLVHCCLNADKFLPCVKMKKSNKPYWRKEVQPYKIDSIQWHNLWRECGEPRDGVIYQSKTEAHRQYMYATRRYKQKIDQLRKEKMTGAICENRSRDFFNEMKKLNPKVCVTPSIDWICRIM